MSITVLSDAQVEEILQQTKNAFSDFEYFDALVAVKLKQAIRDSSKLVISFVTTKKVADMYYDRKAFKGSGDLELIWKHIKVIFRFAYVAIVAFSIPTDDEMEREKRKEFLELYPQILSQQDVDCDELNRLFVFWKMMKIALTIITPEKNKQTLIDICGRFEGSQEFYITGTGQRPEVSNRVLIYELESGVEPEKRPWRAPAAEAVGSAKKRRRNRSSINPSKVPKNVNHGELSQDDIQQLVDQLSPRRALRGTFASDFSHSSFSSSLPDSHSSNAASSAGLLSSQNVVGGFYDGSVFQSDILSTDGNIDEHLHTLLTADILSDSINVPIVVPSGFAVSGFFNETIEKGPRRRKLKRQMEN